MHSADTLPSASAASMAGCSPSVMVAAKEPLDTRNVSPVASTTSCAVGLSARDDRYASV